MRSLRGQLSRLCGRHSPCMSARHPLGHWPLRGAEAAGHFAEEKRPGPSGKLRPCRKCWCKQGKSASKGDGLCLESEVATRWVLEKGNGRNGRHGRGDDKRRHGDAPVHGRPDQPAGGAPAAGRPVSAAQAAPRRVGLIAAAIERCRGRETSVGAMVETCLAGVPASRIEDVSELPWGSGASAATVSNLNGRASASVEGWRPRPLDGEWPLHQLLELPQPSRPADCSVVPSSYLADTQ